MRFVLSSTLALSLAATAAPAQVIGVTLANFEFDFIQSLKAAYEARTDAELIITDAAGDGATQLQQIEGFVAQGVDAIIVNPIEPDDGITISMTAGDIPLVYVNQQPINGDMLPATQGYVGSDENQSGTLEMTEVCRLMGGEGSVAILIGNVATNAARTRTQANYNVLESPECAGITIAKEGQADWMEDRAEAMVAEWLSGGLDVDAYVANNDSMALGAIKALQSAGVSMDDVVVAGIDATSSALDAMAAGDLDVTVFQNAAGQADASVDLALDLIAGSAAAQKVWVEFELVVPANRADYVN